MCFSYSNTLGWNTFALPVLTEQDRAARTRCAEEILLAREEHFPATIADLYDSATMPANTKEDRNDAVGFRVRSPSFLNQHGLLIQKIDVF